MNQKPQFVVLSSADAGVLTWHSTHDTFDAAADAMTEILDQEVLEEGEVVMVQPILAFYQQQ